MPGLVIIRVSSIQPLETLNDTDDTSCRFIQLQFVKMLKKNRMKWTDQPADQHHNPQSLQPTRQGFQKKWGNIYEDSQIYGLAHL